MVPTVARTNEHPAGATPATHALSAAGVAHTLHPYAHDEHRTAGSSWGLEAAEALGLDPATVFKTLVVEVDGTPAPGLGVAVLAVTHQLDLKAVAAALGGKRARLAEPAAAERATGYVLGGISPLGQRRRLPTVVDHGASTHPRVYVSGGRRGLDIGLAPDDLVRMLDAVLAPVAQGC